MMMMMMMVDGSDDGSSSSSSDVLKVLTLSVVRTVCLSVCLSDVRKSCA